MIPPGPAEPGGVVGPLKPSEYSASTAEVRQPSELSQGPEKHGDHGDADDGGPEEIVLREIPERPVQFGHCPASLSRSILADSEPIQLDLYNLVIMSIMAGTEPPLKTLSTRRGARKGGEPRAP